MKLKTMLPIIIILLIIAGGIFYYKSSGNKAPITNEENNENIPPVSEEFDGNASEKYNLIRLTSPKPNQVITSTLTIEGEARGNWYFEATFPIVLVDWDGRIIAEHYAEAQGEWMTTEFVPFKATLNFTLPELPEGLRRGSLILQKSNASGLPEHDDALEIPIRFE
jgi:hypothetical protein